MAVNRIKGITIEIGGDTTKLQAAVTAVGVDADQTRILEESRNTVSWIYEIIKKYFVQQSAESKLKLKNHPKLSALVF